MRFLFHIRFRHGYGYCHGGKQSGRRINREDLDVVSAMHRMHHSDRLLDFIVLSFLAVDVVRVGCTYTYKVRLQSMCAPLQYV